MSSGFRSLFAFWQGGYGKIHEAEPASGGVRSLFAFWQGGYGKQQAVGTITASLDVTEAADTLESAATVPTQDVFGGGVYRPRRRASRPERLPTIHVALIAWEQPDTCEATVVLGLDLVMLDNDLMLLSAA